MMVFLITLGVSVVIVFVGDWWLTNRRVQRAAAQARAERARQEMLDRERRRWQGAIQARSPSAATPSRREDAVFSGTTTSDSD